MNWTKLLPTCECVVPNLKRAQEVQIQSESCQWSRNESEPSDTTGEIPAADIQGTSP